MAKGGRMARGATRRRQHGEGDTWRWGDTACGATRVTRGEGGRGKGVPQQVRRNRVTRQRQRGEGDAWR
jgi:hypothetical protein